jgi:hypothetical protein
MSRRTLLATVVIVLVGCASPDSEVPSGEAGPSTTPVDATESPASSDAPADEPATTDAPTTTSTSTTSTTLAPARPIAEWTSEQLPAPTSELIVCESTLLYQTVIDETLHLIGVDGVSGTERFRVAADPGSILGGQTGVPEVDCERGQAYVITPDGNASAVELASGGIRWTSTQADIGRISICEGDPCALTQPAGGFLETRLDAMDGTLVTRISLRDGRILAAADDFRLFALGDRLATGPTSLVGYQGQEEQWTMPIEDIVDLVGHRFTPSTGWYGLATSDPDLRVQYFGPTLDEEQTGADRVTAGGVVFAYRVSTGEVVWARDNLMSCGMAHELVCRFDGYTDGTLDLSILERFDLETGETMWTLPVDDRRPVVARVGDDLRLTSYEDFQIIDTRYVDADSGAVLDGPTPRAYAVCWNWDAFTGPDDAELTAFSAVLGEARTWSPPDLFYPCDDDGSMLADGELIASEPELLAQFATSGSEGWYFFTDGRQIAGLQLDG